MGKKDTDLSDAEKYRILKAIIAEARKVLALNGGKDIVFVRGYE